MWAAEAPARAAARAEQRSLSGWGRSRWARSRVIKPAGAEQIAESLAHAPRGGGGVIARGAGLSYGDAAQRDGGTVLDTSELDSVLSIDPQAGLVTAEAGATVAQLMHRLAAHHLTLPVVPGTRHVTLAGAIASDIHGKNHHRDGALARHVESISLCTPTGELLKLSAQEQPQLFFATLGGMGLTGVVVQATLRAAPLRGAWVLEDLDRTDGLEQTVELLGRTEERGYSVAWLDMLAPGSKMGRGLISRADPMPAEGAPPQRRRGPAGYRDELRRAPRFTVPHRCPPWLLRPASVQALNAARWAASPRLVRNRPRPLVPYLFPLDAIAAWNRLYGRRGFIQYQFVVPSGEEAALRGCIEQLRRVPVYLAVFKRFGARFGGPLSFPLEGWTLAADIPAGAPGLYPRLEELDELVAACGGRVYLAKDSRMRAETLAAMYPELDRFTAQLAAIDPESVMRSDLAQRLGIHWAA